MTQRAADRKRMIADLDNAGDPLAHDFVMASERAVAATRMARGGGDFPLLSGGDRKPLFALRGAFHDHREAGR